jgi:hypothetical protein
VEVGLGWTALKRGVEDLDEAAEIAGSVAGGDFTFTHEDVFHYLGNV